MDDTGDAGAGSTRGTRRARPAWPGAARRRSRAGEPATGDRAGDELILLRERLRIAGDLCDLLARDAGRGPALDEHLRHLQAVLTAPVADTDTGEAPAIVDLDGLDAIVAPFVAEGLDVRVTARIPDGLCVVLALHAGRIVEAALDNVLRHSAARSARVLVTKEAGRLVVEVTDPGPSREQAAAVSRPRGAGDGTGLVGIRERVRIAGGAVTAGSVGTGFQVRAVLPL